MKNRVPGLAVLVAVLALALGCASPELSDPVQAQNTRAPAREAEMRILRAATVHGEYRLRSRLGLHDSATLRAVPLLRHELDGPHREPSYNNVLREDAKPQH